MIFKLIKDLDIYLMIIDNGIFVYNTFNNELLNYIDINDELKYNEINSITYYYNNIDIAALRCYNTDACGAVYHSPVRHANFVFLLQGSANKYRLADKP